MTTPPPTPVQPRVRYGFDGKKMTVREACRERLTIDGSDAQALEHGLTQVERERDEALRLNVELSAELVTLRAASATRCPGCVQHDDACEKCGDGERRTWFEIEAKWGDDWVVPSWENNRELPSPLTIKEAREQLAAHQAATKYPFLRIVEVTRRTLDTTDAKGAK